MGQALHAVADEAKINLLIDIRIEKGLRPGWSVACRSCRCSRLWSCWPTWPGLPWSRGATCYITSPPNAERLNKVDRPAVRRQVGSHRVTPIAPGRTIGTAHHFRGNPGEVVHACIS